MAPCPYCNITNQPPTARIPPEVLSSCLKNRYGSCLACKKLSDIRGKISDARRVLERLLEEQEQLAGLVNEHHDPFLCRLPVEMVSRVFLHCLPSLPTAYTSDVRYKEYELINAVLTPGRICRNWRRIARSTPALWAVICDTVTSKNCIDSITAIQEWLGRSGGLSLFIQIEIYAPAPLGEAAQDLCDYTAKRLLASIAAHAARWEVADISLPIHLVEWLSTLLSTKNFNRLLHLKLDFYQDEQPDTPSLQLDAAPRYLTYHSTSLHMVSVDWTRLTHAVLKLLYVKDGMLLFRNACNLLFCEIDEGGDLLPPDTLSPVVGPSLKILHIECFPYYFWDYFTFPSLENLEILDPRHGPQQLGSWRGLGELLLRSSCKIRSLTVQDDMGEGYEHQLVDLLHRIPTLERLTIMGYIIEVPLFSMMTTATTSEDALQPSNFLSKLKFLKLTGTGDGMGWSWLVLFVVAMKSKSLETLEIQYTGRKEFETFLSKEYFKHFMDDTADMKISIVGRDGSDLVERLCSIYGR